MYKHLDGTPSERVEGTQHIKCRGCTEPENALSFVEKDICLQKQTKKEIASNLTGDPKLPLKTPIFYSKKNP